MFYALGNRLKSNVSGINPLSYAAFFFDGSAFLDAGGDAVSDAEAVATINNLSTKAIAYDDAIQSTAGNRPVATVGAETYATFDGTNDILVTTTYQGTLQAAYTPPDGAAGAAAGRGFTNTGLARNADGTWWVGNDGRPGTAASVVKLSADFSTILDEIDFDAIYGYTGTIQGVAIDPSDSSLWVAFPASNLVRHIDITDGSTIESIDTSATGSPNGVAWDPADDTILITINLSIRRYSSSTLSLVETLTSLPGGIGSLDHITIDNTGLLWATVAATSTSPGQLYIYQSEWYKVMDVTAADSIEGIVVTADSITLCNDAYFHHGGARDNEIMVFDRPPHIGLFDVVEIGVNVDASGLLDIIMATGGGIRTPGVCISTGVSSTSVLRIFSSTNTGGVPTTRDVIDFNVSDLSAGPTTIRIRLDYTAKTARLWQDGVEVTPAKTLTNAGPKIACGRQFQIGGMNADLAYTALPSSGYLAGSIYSGYVAYGITEAQGAALESRL